MKYINFKFNGRDVSSKTFLSEDGIVTIEKYKNDEFVSQAITEKVVFDSYIKEKLEERSITIIQ